MSVNKKQYICNIIHHDILTAVAMLNSMGRQKHAFKQLMILLDYLILKKKITLDMVKTDLSMSRNTFYHYFKVLKKLRVCVKTFNYTHNQRVFTFRRSAYLELFLFFVFSIFIIYFTLIILNYGDDRF